MLHNVLWTSGWESTYRVVDLILNKKEEVQPYYILDNKRVSSKVEINTMKKIKRMLIEQDPEAENLLKDTIVFNIRDIPKDEELTSNYYNLANRSHLGGQYDWLARFAKSEGLDDLELCIHRDDKAGEFILDDIITTEDKGGFKLRDELSYPELNLFSYFRFPLFEVSKLEIEQKAKEYGFSHIMEETWFCHSPVNNKPCGLCNPCKYTIEEGLGRRVPNPTLKNKVVIFSRKVKNKLFK